MKILFIGAVQFSKEALLVSLQSNAEVVGVCTLSESSFNSDHCDLSPVAESYEIPVHYVKNINSLEVLFRTEQRRRLGVVKNTISRLIELYDKENEGLETNYKLENGHKPELVDCCPFTKNNFYVIAALEKRKGN